MELEDVVKELSKSGWKCSKKEPETILCFNEDKEVFIEPFYTLDKQGYIIRCGWAIHMRRKNVFHYDIKSPRRLEDAKRFAETVMRNWDKVEKHFKELQWIGAKVD